MHSVAGIPAMDVRLENTFFFVKNSFSRKQEARPWDGSLILLGKSPGSGIVSRVEAGRAGKPTENFAAVFLQMD